MYYLLRIGCQDREGSIALQKFFFYFSFLTTLFFLVEFFPYATQNTDGTSYPLLSSIFTVLEQKNVYSIFCVINRENVTL